MVLMHLLETERPSENQIREEKRMIPCNYLQQIAKKHHTKKSPATTSRCSRSSPNCRKSDLFSDRSIVVFQKNHRRHQQDLKFSGLVWTH
mmetsp:Transcript_15493/g.42965  ORF Transcript_15493/g.42965 Transcript_15493/m.42965 type:complete len:90 (+) Transcript_15493:439-708(+)